MLDTVRNEFSAQHETRHRNRTSDSNTYSLANVKRHLYGRAAASATPDICCSKYRSPLHSCRAISSVQGGPHSDDTGKAEIAIVASLTIFALVYRQLFIHFSEVALPTLARHSREIPTVNTTLSSALLDTRTYGSKSSAYHRTDSYYRLAFAAVPVGAQACLWLVGGVMKRCFSRAWMMLA
ncbi:hypothetical protein KCU61_g401, partial [Aureobasidium melanogenum]